MATKSGPYDRAEEITGLRIAFIAFTTVWLIFFATIPCIRQQGRTPFLVGILPIIIDASVAFIVGVLMGSRIGWLRRLFTPRNPMAEDASPQAGDIFYDKRVHHSSGTTGILVYVSLFEHRVIVSATKRAIP